MKSESRVQSEVRIAAPDRGMRLWRNQVGAAKTDAGNFVRFGLANESAGVNALLKSADLIGIEPVLITADMVGQTIGRFLSVECKPEGFKPDNSPRYIAQLRWAKLVNDAGGRAIIVTSAEQL